MKLDFVLSKIEIFAKINIVLKSVANYCAIYNNLIMFGQDCNYKFCKLQFTKNFILIRLKHAYFPTDLNSLIIKRSLLTRDHVLVFITTLK